MRVRDQGDLGVAVAFPAQSEARPRQVVLHDGAGRRIVEIDEPLQLPANPIGALRLLRAPGASLLLMVPTPELSAIVDQAPGFERLTVKVSFGSETESLVELTFTDWVVWLLEKLIVVRPTAE